MPSSTESNLLIKNINGSQATGVTLSGVQLIAVDEKARPMLVSSTLPVSFEPMGITIRSANFSHNPQRKGETLELRIEVDLEEFPAKIFSVMTIDLPLGFNSIVKVAELSGFTSNYGIKLSNPNTITIYSQLPDVDGLIQSTHLSILIQNVLIIYSRWRYRRPTSSTTTCG